MAVIACNMRSTSARAASTVRLEASPPPPCGAVDLHHLPEHVAKLLPQHPLDSHLHRHRRAGAGSARPLEDEVHVLPPARRPRCPRDPPPFPVPDAADRDVPAIGYQVRPDLVEDRVDILGGQLGGSSRRTRGDAPSLGRVVLARRLVVAVVDSDGGPLEGQDDSGALAGRRRRRRRRRPPPAAPSAAMAAATPDEPVPLTKRGGDGDKTAARDSAIVRR